MSGKTKIRGGGPPQSRGFLRDKPYVGKFITFRIGRQGFIMDAARIRGLLPIHELDRLRRPQGWIVAIASVSGQDFPVVDLAAKLGLGTGDRGCIPCIVAVQNVRGRLIGFIADRVTNVIALNNPDLSTGTVRVQGRARRVLDPDAVLDEDFELSL